MDAIYIIATTTAVKGERYAPLRGKKEKEREGYLCVYALTHARTYTEHVITDIYVNTTHNIYSRNFIVGRLKSLFLGWGGTLPSLMGWSVLGGVHSPRWLGLGGGHPPLCLAGESTLIRGHQGGRLRSGRGKDCWLLGGRD